MDQASRGKGPLNLPMERTIVVSDVCGMECQPRHTRMTLVKLFTLYEFQSPLL